MEEVDRYGSIIWYSKTCCNCKHRLLGPEKEPCNICIQSKKGEKPFTKWEKDYNG